jgi:hypothetical protein
VLVTNALVPGAARYRVDPDDAVCEYTVDDPAGLLPLVGNAGVRAQQNHRDIHAAIRGGFHAESVATEGIAA